MHSIKTGKSREISLEKNKTVCSIYMFSCFMLFCNFIRHDWLILMSDWKCSPSNIWIPFINWHLTSILGRQKLLLLYSLILVKNIISNKLYKSKAGLHRCNTFNTCYANFFRVLSAIYTQQISDGISISKKYSLL